MSKRTTGLRQSIEVARQAYETGRISYAKDTLDLINTQLIAELVEVLYQINDSLAKATRDKEDIQRLLLEYAPAPKPPTKKP